MKKREKTNLGKKGKLEKKREQRCEKKGTEVEQRRNKR